MVLFRDRSEAGRELAAALGSFGEEPDVIVLGLPRGGVPVALEVAERLDAPLDVFVVRKLGVPGFEELAMGAVASGGSSARSSGGRSCTGGTAQSLIQPDGRPSWSTTAWPRAPPSAPRWRRCAGGARRGWWSACRSPPLTSARSSSPRWRTLSARELPSDSVP